MSSSAGLGGAFFAGAAAGFLAPRLVIASGAPPMEAVAGLKGVLVVIGGAPWDAGAGCGAAFGLLRDMPLGLFNDMPTTGAVAGGCCLAGCCGRFGISSIESIVVVSLSGDGFLGDFFCKCIPPDLCTGVASLDGLR